MIFLIILNLTINNHFLEKYISKQTIFAFNYFKNDELFFILLAKVMIYYLSFFIIKI